MFTKIDLKALRDELKQEVEKELSLEHNQDIQSLEKDHELEIRELEFKMDHLESAEIKKFKDETLKLKEKVAVLEKENEMLRKITDLNADIIDVKDVVNQLIKKLPEININQLALQTGKKDE